MKSKVVYYSKSGNTKKIADAIALELNCEVTDINTPINESIDTLFLGASVYKFGIDKQVLSFINSLDSNLVKNVVIFSTSAMSDSGYPKLVSALKDKNIVVSEKHFYCKGSFMMMNKNRPNLDDVNDARQFAKSI